MVHHLVCFTTTSTPRHRTLNLLTLTLAHVFPDVSFLQYTSERLPIPYIPQFHSPLYFVHSPIPYTSLFCPPRNSVQLPNSLRLSIPYTSLIQTLPNSVCLSIPYALLFRPPLYSTCLPNAICLTIPYAYLILSASLFHLPP